MQIKIDGKAAYADALIRRMLHPDSQRIEIQCSAQELSSIIKACCFAARFEEDRLSEQQKHGSEWFLPHGPYELGWIYVPIDDAFPDVGCETVTADYIASDKAERFLVLHLQEY